MQSPLLPSLSASHRMSLLAYLESPYPLGAYEAFKQRARVSLHRYHCHSVSSSGQRALPGEFEVCSKERARLEVLTGPRWLFRAFHL